MSHSKFEALKAERRKTFKNIDFVFLILLKASEKIDAM